MAPLQNEKIDNGGIFNPSQQSVEARKRKQKQKKEKSVLKESLIPKSIGLRMIRTDFYLHFRTELSLLMFSTLYSLR